MVDYKANTEKIMAEWWQSPLGHRILAQEQTVIQSLTAHFHGYYQLQIGIKQPLLPSLSRPCIQKVMALSADVQGESISLPFKCHSIDSLLLGHVLEFSSEPHQVLREVERILVADGTVVLCCFNPWSLWGLRRLLSWQEAPPWQGTFFSQTRIKDWLALLNFEVVSSKHCLYRPAIQSPKWFDRLNVIERWGKRLWPIFSGITILVAKKRTIPLTPVTMSWRAKQLFPNPLAQRPASRGNVRTPYNSRSKVKS